MYGSYRKYELSQKSFKPEVPVSCNGEQNPPRKQPPTRQGPDYSCFPYRLLSRSER